MKAILFLILLPLTGYAKPFEIQRWQTRQGAQVIFHQSMEVPMLDIGVAFRAGSAYDGKQFGLSTLTMNLLNEGSGGQSGAVIAQQLARTGAQYAATNNQDMIALSLRTLVLPSALQPAIHHFALTFSQPDFPTPVFKRVKNLQRMRLAQERESPNALNQNAFYQSLYQQHPYAHPIDGQPDTVNALTLAEVRAFYHQYFVARNAVIVLVGAIDITTAKQISEQLTEHLSTGQSAAEIPRAKPLSEAMDIVVQYPSTQTIVRLGQLGITHQDPDYFALQVGNYILGGNPMGSRLAQALREQQGLTYGVTSQILPMPGLGVFMINFSTRNRQAKIAIELTRSLLKTFIQTGPTEEELTATKHYVTGSFPLSLASNRNIVEILLKIGFYHLPEDFLTTYTSRINAVTTADVKRAFQHKMNAEKMLQVTVGKPS